MKKLVLLLYLFFSTLAFSQSKAQIFTVYNDEIILTGNDRMNLYSDVIDSIKILKGEESSDYFEQAGGVILIYLRNKMDRKFLTKEEINELLEIPSQRPIYINEVKLLKDLKFSYNSKTKLEKIKINKEYYSNIVID